MCDYKVRLCNAGGFVGTNWDAILDGDNVVCTHKGSKRRRDVALRLFTRRLVMVLMMGWVAWLMIGVSFVTVGITERVEAAFNAATEKSLVEDARLEDAIRKELRLPVRGAEGSNKLTKEDLEKLSILDASNLEITSLSGLEFATQLIALDFSENKIKDISVISKLTSLDVLVVQNLNIQSLDFVVPLKRLHVISASKNSISSIEQLRQLSHIRFIELDNNNIADLSPLLDLHELESGSFRGNQISDLSPLLSHKVSDRDRKLENPTFLITLDNPLSMKQLELRRSFQKRSTRKIRT